MNSNNSLILIVISFGLFLNGLIGYIVSEMASLSALFPVLFGFIYIGIAIYLNNHNSGYYIILAGFLVSLLGILLSHRGLISFIKGVLAFEFLFPLITWSQTIMAILCFVIGILYVCIFFQLRLRNNGNIE